MQKLLLRTSLSTTLVCCGVGIACTSLRTPEADRAPLATSAAGGCRDSVVAFRRIVTDFQVRQQNVALSVGVRQRGRTVFREATGFANADTQLVATPEMAFSIASITKAFTGAALLILVDRGRIDLDAEIHRYVPEFPHHPSGRPVTVRMLAHHLGSVRHWGPERNDAVYARHFDDVMDILPLFRDSAWVDGLAPLTKYSYSSYGYNALAMVIQRASGMSYQQAVTTLVLDPLHLRSVQFDRPGLGGSRRPARYSWYDLQDYRDLTDSPQRVPDWDYSHNMGGGGLTANVDDLLAFAEAMRSEGLLSRASHELLWRRPVLSNVESSMSVGWFPSRDGTRMSISGSNAGVQAALSVWKAEDVEIAVLANSWGRGSRSGELMSDDANGFVGRLAAVCGVR